MAQPGVHVRAVLGCFAMGRLVLDELESLKLEEKTLVVFLGM